MADKEDKRNQLIMDFHNTFNSEAGKRVLSDIIDKTSYNRKAVIENLSVNIDPYRVVYEEGKRVLILYILGMLNKRPNEKLQETAINKE